VAIDTTVQLECTRRCGTWSAARVRREVIAALIVNGSRRSSSTADGTHLATAAADRKVMLWGLPDPADAVAKPPTAKATLGRFKASRRETGSK
jgi:WD40 repeat protein